jgi:Ca-activated chloride channel family protein
VLQRPPWVHEVPLPGPDPAVLHAVATLADGTTAEDSLLLNAPQADQVNVDLVELYTAVVDPRGRPVRGLGERDFRVIEEGVPQRLERFAEVTDLPVHVALLLDTSTSMTLRLPQVRQAALQFLQQLVRPQDEVMVVTLDDGPVVRAGFTHDLAFLGNGLEGLEARGGTALYDSLIFGLQALQDVKGQRVLVLLSDGVDERSRATVAQVMELARRAAVTIYTIGIEDDRPMTPTLDRPLLTKLAEETGGRSFFVSGTSHLTEVYAEVQRDMRSRYLLAYYSSHADDRRSFRLVDVRVDQPRAAARTIRGYYP